jgi:hypothetical protein
MGTNNTIQQFHIEINLFLLQFPFPIPARKVEGSKLKNQLKSSCYYFWLGSQAGVYHSTIVHIFSQSIFFRFLDRYIVIYPIDYLAGNSSNQSQQPGRCTPTR